MRIRRVEIRQWRNFENIELQLDQAAALVCVVGANGTGKSHLLELIAACAHHLGLSAGISNSRGNPFSDPHDFELQFFLAEGVSEAVEGLANEAAFAQWDRTLTIRSRGNLPGEAVNRISAGGIADEHQSGQLARQVVARLSQTKEVNFVSLDADRAYPSKSIAIHEIAQAYEIDWDALNYTRGKSYMPTTTLYDEWIKYFLARENQAGISLMKGIRRARTAGEAEPRFADHFEPYKSALQKVLPHIVFTGVDEKRRTLVFDTTGLELNFNQLSGGEREIAFLVGQIDRFGLRQGLFLLDEPELHLNADLIRTWVAYLTSTIETGQIWLATHSLEAVEAAGQQATFILERNEETRKVDHLARLDTRPVLSALSRAVGTPAFSISQLLFVFVEGEESVGERERFRKLAGLPQNVRFMECGSSNEVLRRVSAIRSLANEAEARIRIGGVIDRDFRTEADANALANDQNVFVLPVHEVENLFLEPGTLAALAGQNGLNDLMPADAIRVSADDRAGSWIFQHAMSTRNAGTLPKMAEAAKELAKGLTWNDIEGDGAAAIQNVVAASGYDNANAGTLRAILEISTNAYARKRGEGDFWTVCEGKQVLNAVAREFGYANAQALILAALAAWERDQGLLPEAVAEFRRYLARL